MRLAHLQGGKENETRRSKLVCDTEKTLKIQTVQNRPDSLSFLSFIRNKTQETSEK